MTYRGGSRARGKGSIGRISGRDIAGERVREGSFHMRLPACIAFKTSARCAALLLAHCVVEGADERSVWRLNRLRVRSARVASGVAVLFSVHVLLPNRFSCSLALMFTPQCHKSCEIGIDGKCADWAVEGVERFGWEAGEGRDMAAGSGERLRNIS